jgi:hypothetical protein
MKRHVEALAYFDRALVLQPRCIPALYNRGHTLLTLGRAQEALRSLDRVLAIDPIHVDALYARANALNELLRSEEALAGFDDALARAPARADIHLDKALTLLRLGDYRSGWPKYEWRHIKAGAQFSHPPWYGVHAPSHPDMGPGLDLRGKSILLHAEQGYGDTLQFVRYASMVADRGARVVLEVQPALKTLMGSLQGPDTVIARGEERPTVDCHCPLLTLPLAFGTDIHSIPGQVPYLRAPDVRVSVWRDKLAGRRTRVGLVWAGNPDHSGDRKRSIPFKLLVPLLAMNDIDFIGLQRDVPKADESAISTCPSLRNLGEDLTDFVETAAAITHLDLVISVDTALAHLAGALAKPVWILLPTSPDFRWMLDREDSPWYPSARLFRQSVHRDWPSVIARVQRELTRELRRETPFSMPPQIAIS